MVKYRQVKCLLDKCRHDSWHLVLESWLGSLIKIGSVIAEILLIWTNIEPQSSLLTSWHLLFTQQAPIRHLLDTFKTHSGHPPNTLYNLIFLYSFYRVLCTQNNQLELTVSTQKSPLKNTHWVLRYWVKHPKFEGLVWLSEFGYI